MTRVTPAGASSLDAVIDRYKQDIDVTLIEANLRLTVEERLAELQRLVAFAEELRRAGLATPPRS
jgi:hypothetical protein